MRELDPNEVYLRALQHPGGAQDLDDVELLVYAVKEVEVFSSMEGWDAFFVGSCSYLYPDVRRCLTACSDTRSLAVLDDYVAYHSSRGIPFEPEAIEKLWFRETDEEAAQRTDWYAAFHDAGPERWQRIAAYLRTVGVELVEKPVAPSAEVLGFVELLQRSHEGRVEAATASIRERARRAFTSVREAHPAESFYCFALVTTTDGLRPMAWGVSREARERASSRDGAGPGEIQWSEAEAPTPLFPDGDFTDAEELFVYGGGGLPPKAAEAAIHLRFTAMERALAELDREGFFGVGSERHRVVINVLVRDEPNEVILARAARLNPEESLADIRRDLGPED
jgi:hypothetical protein